MTNADALSDAQAKTLRAIADGVEPTVHMHRIRWLITHHYLIGGPRHRKRGRFVTLTPKACAALSVQFTHTPRLVVLQSPCSVLPAQR